MNEIIKMCWIDALTSGEYWQTTEELKSETGYCCLGVLCDLHRKMTGEGKWDESGYYHSGGESDDIGLIDPVIKWAGVASTTAKYGNNNLVNKNDNGKSFMEIAEIIFENF